MATTNRANVVVHLCHAGCGKPCPPAHLMCRKCWSKVPTQLQGPVYTALDERKKNGNKESWATWSKAAHAAILAVNPNAENLRSLARIAGLEPSLKIEVAGDVE